MSENPLNSVQENLDHRGFDETPQQVFERYLHFLQITPKEFEGKSVLDVGAGSAGFAKYVQDAQLSTTVVSVDRNLNENESPVTKAMYVVAKAQDLPFKDGTFDYVVSVFTLPHVAADYLHTTLSAEQRKKERLLSTAKAVSDCLRVVKKGGEIRFGGVPSIYPHQLDGWKDGLLGYTVDIEDTIETNGLLIIRKR